MLCYVMLSYVMLCYVTLCYVTLRYVTSYLRYVMSYYINIIFGWGRVRGRGRGIRKGMEPFARPAVNVYRTAATGMQCSPYILEACHGSNTAC